MCFAISNVNLLCRVSHSGRLRQAKERDTCLAYHYVTEVKQTSSLNGSTWVASELGYPDATSGFE